MAKLQGKKVLITGASGFLATYLADACKEEGAILYGIDIRPPFQNNIWKVFLDNGLIDSSVEYLFKDYELDIVFHLAGGASVGASVQNPEADFNSLLPPTFKLIQLVKDFCPQTHFVLFSSAAVYGNPDRLPVTEEAAIHPVSPYGIHKAMVEDMLKYYSTYYGLRSSVLRIFSAFGEGLRKQLFWDVMKRYQKQIQSAPDLQSIEFDMFGTGNESRDFIHASDVAKAALTIATCETDIPFFDVYNVANGIETNIRTAVEHLFSNAPIQAKLNFTGNTRAGDPEKWRADIEKLKSIGYIVSQKLDEHLTEYCRWFLGL